jgi:MFS family permease
MMTSVPLEGKTTSVKISLVILAAMGIMSGIAIVASLPLISLTFSDVEHIDFLSKLLLTLPSFVIALLAPISGIIVDKIGRLKPLYFGVTLFVIAGSSGFYIENFYLLLLRRALLGVGVAFIMTASMALIGDYFEEKERHQFISLQGMVVGLSGIVFILSGGFLAEIAWNFPFLIYLLPLLFLPLILKSLYEPEVVSHKETSEVQTTPTKLFLVYFIGFFSMLLFYMLPTQLPYLVIEELGGSPSEISYFIATAMFVNAMVAKQYHHLKKRFSYAQIFMITYFSFGIGLLIISQVSLVVQLFGASLFMGIGFGLVIVNINMWLLSLVEPTRRGRAIGMLTSSFFLGQFLSPILLQPIVSAVGIQGLFFVISLLSFVIAIGLLIKTKYFVSKA